MRIHTCLSFLFVIPFCLSFRSEAEESACVVACSCFCPNAVILSGAKNPAFVLCCLFLFLRLLLLLPVLCCHSERSEESPHLLAVAFSQRDWSGHFIDENIGTQQAAVNTQAVAAPCNAPLEPTKPTQNSCICRAFSTIRQ
jgi:hypothetical protein